ncbi:hypothetical protein AVEN_231015-1 [Araneus ventricosus]|uniref:RNase H type-1 domain-containing protein n=1 Tax=Araneus ventricosus TaxID=182803 RepID=A0A4Y2A3W9_ARAVE|nr:hypothetical protein AVEN_231015-1 [Araneus ventricosus]
MPPIERPGFISEKSDIFPLQTGKKKQRLDFASPSSYQKGKDFRNPFATERRSESEEDFVLGYQRASDSQSSQIALADLQPISTFPLEILNIWSSLTTEVVIYWVKGHSGVLRNEVADQLARQASHGSTLNIKISLNLALKNLKVFN